MLSLTGTFHNTVCSLLTRVQQALNGAFFKISTCGLLQIVGTEKGICFIYEMRSAEGGNLSGFFFLVLLMIIKLDFKRFNMLFLDSC